MCSIFCKIRVGFKNDALLVTLAVDDADLTLGKRIVESLSIALIFTPRRERQYVDHNIACKPFGWRSLFTSVSNGSCGAGQNSGSPGYKLLVISVPKRELISE